MPESKLANTAAFLLRPLKYLFGWIVGSFLFLFIVIYMVFSFFRKRLQGLLRLPELYHFRENQFPTLDVTLQGDEKEILLGKLPVAIDTIVHYQLPVIDQAKEVLLELKLETFPGSCMELGYYLYGNETKEKKEYAYFFINALPGFPGLNYNSVLCWCPVPANHTMSAELVDIVSDQPLTGFSGVLNIIRWR